MNNITLDYQDLKDIWNLVEIKGNIKNPLREMRPFFTYFSDDYPQYKSLTEEFTIFDYDAHKLMDKESFCTKFADKIQIDENFIFFITGLPYQELKLKHTKKIFELLQNKYPDFTNQLTKALEKQKNIKFHATPIITGWMGLVKAEDFKQKDPHVFIYNDIYNTQNIILKKIAFLERYSFEKSKPILEKILKTHNNVPVLVEACEHLLIKNNIPHEKKNFSFYEDDSYKLYHYDMIFKPQGLMQNYKLKETDAMMFLRFTAFYLSRLVNYVEKERQNEIDRVKLHIKSFSKPLVEEATQLFKKHSEVIFNHCVTSQNMKIIKQNNFDENLCNELQEYIKVFLVKEKIEEDLIEKSTLPSKIKI